MDEAHFFKYPSMVMWFKSGWENFTAFVDPQVE